MVESVDAPDLKSVEHHARGSSSLPTPTCPKGHFHIISVISIMIDQFISDLKTIPSEEYKKFFIQANKVAAMYPLNEGIDCFARGEAIEFGFIENFSKYIEIKASKKKQKNDPDALYRFQNLFDAKTKKLGLEPNSINPKRIKTKTWDFKKTQSGVSEFKTMSEWFVLIDPWTHRLAVLDTKVLFSKKFTDGKARITFPVAQEDITMIYDGINDVEEVNVVPESKTLLKYIWGQAQ
jgi:hypothetical protein